MRSYRAAKLMHIGTTSVLILVLVLAGAAFIYHRYSRPGGSAQAAEQTLEAEERMEELVELTSHNTEGK